MASSYDNKKIAEKWTKKWQEKGIYKVNLKNPKRKWYNLMMFPYPSAEGLHVGNMYAFTGADWYGRFNSMQGHEVFEPIGLDGFGIHSENYALKVGKHPADLSKVSQKHFYEQLHKLGNRFNWAQSLETYDPDYYKWTQWLFVKMFEHGLAYRQASLVNWCPSCKTVLADEQVENGRCERCDTVTTRKETKQWFFKITEYADKLLNDLDKIDWPKKITTAQRNWIGKSDGLSIDFTVKKSGKKITIWTKFWETIFGTTYLVLAPEHKLVGSLITGKGKDVHNYVSQALTKSEQERLAGAGDKTGVDTGEVAINPVNGQEVPIWIADYVLKDVGTAAVMGVPAHDERDFAFVKKYNLPIIQVVEYADKKIDRKVAKGEMAYEGEGKLVNSGQFDGLSAWGEGKEKMADWMIKQSFARWETTYHLRDWLISRQRYWGPPIPMLNCPKCGWQPVPVKDLPVKLPYVKDYQPTGDGKSPLEKAPKEWLEVDCPKCGGKARRETDVSDTFLDSSWYFLRYPSVDYQKGPFDPERIKTWLPVDVYIGGAEHAVLHLLYSRFVWMALQDWGDLPKSLGPEPFPFLFSHGLIIKDGNKMSKSRGNVVNPDEYIDAYGADALRMYLMFLGPYDQGGDFRDTGIRGMTKFLGRIWRLVANQADLVLVEEKDSREVLVKLHQTVKRVTEDMGQFKFNTAVAALMELVNLLEEKTKSKDVKKSKGNLKCAEWAEALTKLTLMLAPMAPFLAEELWQKLGGKFSVHRQAWPQFDPELAKEEKLTLVVQVNGKVRGQFVVDRDKAKDKGEMIKTAYAQERVKLNLKGKKVVKEIFVPGKLVNLVTKG